MMDHEGYGIGRDGETLFQNSRGQWVPAVPAPYFRFIGFSCPKCKERYWTMKGYQGHYALKHILDPMYE